MNSGIIREDNNSQVMASQRNVDSTRQIIKMSYFWTSLVYFIENLEHFFVCVVLGNINLGYNWYHHRANQDDRFDHAVQHFKCLIFKVYFRKDLRIKD